MNVETGRMRAIGIVMHAGPAHLQLQIHIC
jgi:hypothetical protein